MMWSLALVRKTTDAAISRLRQRNRTLIRTITALSQELDAQYSGTPDAGIRFLDTQQLYKNAITALNPRSTYTM